MSDTAEIESVAPPSDEGLRAYLAERDVPCPGCGYNLRGTQDAVCPECGGPIELTVTRAASGRGWLLFLLLALGWVFLAAGMHTTRTALAARDEARVVTGIQMLFSSTTTFNSTTSIAPLTINRSTLGTTGPARGPVAVRGGPITAGRVVAGSPSNPVTITTQPGGGFSVVTRAGNPAVATGPAATMAWSQVRTQTWVSLGISTLLGLLAAIVLLTVVFRRRTIVHAGPSRILVIFSLAVFAAYAAGQVFLFARDLVG